MSHNKILWPFNTENLNPVKLKEISEEASCLVFWCKVNFSITQGWSRSFLSLSAQYYSGDCTPGQLGLSSLEWYKFSYTQLSMHNLFTLWKHVSMSVICEVINWVHFFYCNRFREQNSPYRLNIIYVCIIMPLAIIIINTLQSSLFSTLYIQCTMQRQVAN